MLVALACTPDATNFKADLMGEHEHINEKDNFVSVVVFGSVYVLKKIKPDVQFQLLLHP